MKVIRISCFMLGIVLLLAALLLVLYNLREDRHAEHYAASVIEVLHQPRETEAPAERTEEDLFGRYVPERPKEMETVEIMGDTYVGTITIPEIGIELPVLSEWSSEGLKKAPCRYKGSCFTDDLILAAHNYPSHFGKIRDLSANAEILFTDVTGRQFLYEVAAIEQVDGTDVDGMERGAADEWDLTLFTCTLDGRARVTVRAVGKGRNEG